MTMTKDNSLDFSQINQDLHWAFSYIGRPWVNGAQGPEAFDCWSFLRYVQKNHFGLDLPFINANADDFRVIIANMDSNPERQNWRRVAMPREGDAVLMAHSKYPSHVGVWLEVDGGGALHCIRGEGVVFSRLSSLKNCGWGRLEYYRHESNT